MTGLESITSNAIEGSENNKNNVKQEKEEVNLEQYESSLKARKDEIVQAEILDDEEVENILLALDGKKKESGDNGLTSEIRQCMLEGLTKTLHYPFYHEESKSEQNLDIFVCGDGRKLELSAFGLDVGTVELKSASPELWELDCLHILTLDLKEAYCSPLLNDCLNKAIELCIN